MGDSFATARLYDRFIQIFLSTALGWDFDKHESKPQGGLFGKVKAFYGLTEPQMDGHPHMHLLVWSEDLPRTTIQYEDMVGDDDEEDEEDNCNNLNSATAKYTDSVVRRTLPLSLSHSFCDECSTETEFHVLPIKERYKMNPNLYKRLDESSGGLQEPLLAACDVCSTEVSSNKLIQNALRKEELKLDFSETATQKEIFDEIVLLPLPPIRTSRVKSMQKYATTLIAANFQQHKWMHCKSCFKKSVRTKSEDYCRYCFPTDRQSKTIMTKEGIKLKCLLGHEFINGFNDVI